MPFCKLNLDMIQCALRLPREGHQLDDVAEILNVSMKRVPRWAGNLEQRGSVNSPSILHGRPCHFDVTVRGDLQHLLAEIPCLFLDKAAQWLAVAR
ncbi:hypothetical protein BV22DRAFT_994548, partial [Leucogyrophana mollusca]